MLIWYCTSCRSESPVDPSNGYEKGDWEPCVHCDGGTAYVIDCCCVGYFNPDCVFFDANGNTHQHLPKTL